MIRVRTLRHLFSSAAKTVLAATYPEFAVTQSRAFRYAFLFVAIKYGAFGFFALGYWNRKRIGEADPTKWTEGISSQNVSWFAETPTDKTKRQTVLVSGKRTAEYAARRDTRDLAEGQTIHGDDDGTADFVHGTFTRSVSQSYSISDNQSATATGRFIVTILRAGYAIVQVTYRFSSRLSRDLNRFGENGSV